MVAEEITKQVPKVTAAFDGQEAKLVVRPRPDFKLEDWTEIEKLSQQHLADGHIHWAFDMAEFRFVTSRMLGLLIGLNAILDIRGGSLELRVPRESGLAASLHQARLSRIMTVTEI